MGMGSALLVENYKSSLLKACISLHKGKDVNKWGMPVLEESKESLKYPLQSEK